MTADERARLEADLAHAEADLERVRAENTTLGEDFREGPTAAKREGLRRAAEALSAARDHALAAAAALRIFERTGSAYGLIAENGTITGAIAGA